MVAISTLLSVVGTIVTLGSITFGVKRYRDKPDDVTNELRPALQGTSYTSPSLHPNVGHRRGGNRTELPFTVTDVHVAFQEDLPPTDLDSLRAAFSLQTTLTLSLDLPVLPWVAEVGGHQGAAELGKPTERVLLQILTDDLESDAVESIAFHQASDAESSPELVVTVGTHNTSEINAVLESIASGLCYAVNSWWLFGQSVEECVESYHEYKAK